MNRDDKVMCSAGHIVKAAEIWEDFAEVSIEQLQGRACPMCQSPTRWKLYQGMRRR